MVSCELDDHWLHNIINEVFYVNSLVDITKCPFWQFTLDFVLTLKDVSLQLFDAVEVSMHLL